jgi:integrase
MTWQEIDLGSKTWTLPAARAKNGRQHVIPLSEQALDVLRSLCPAFGIGGPSPRFSRASACNRRRSSTLN